MSDTLRSDPLPPGEAPLLNVYTCPSDNIRAHQTKCEGSTYYITFTLRTHSRALPRTTGNQAEATRMSSNKCIHQAVDMEGNKPLNA